MASSRKSVRKDSITSSSTMSKAGQNPGPAIVMNTFANDGSFMELFKKRMEAEARKSQQPNHESTEKETHREETEEKDKKKVDEQSCQEKVSDGIKGPGPSIPLTQQGKRTFAVGKMGGAARQIHAKKKKKEKEAADAAKKAEEEAEGKSSAWKAYMEEVQRYKEMTCADDSDRTCPLVK